MAGSYTTPCQPRQGSEMVQRHTACRRGARCSPLTVQHLGARGPGTPSAAPCKACGAGRAGIAFHGACLWSHCSVLQARGDFLGLWELVRESGFAKCPYLIQPKGTLVWVVKPGLSNQELLLGLRSTLDATPNIWKPGGCPHGAPPWRSLPGHSLAGGPHAPADI